MEFMTSYNKENNVYSTQTEEFMYRRKNQHRNQFFIHNTKKLDDSEIYRPQKNRLYILKTFPATEHLKMLNKIQQSFSSQAESYAIFFRADYLDKLF